MNHLKDVLDPFETETRTLSGREVFLGNEFDNIDLKCTPKELIPGLLFAARHSLTPKQMDVLLLFCQGPQSLQSIADKFGQPKPSIHPAVKALRARRVIKTNRATEQGYTFELLRFNNSEETTLEEETKEALE